MNGLKLLTEVTDMKKFTVVAFTLASTFALASASFSGAVPSNGAPTAQADQQTISQLQVAAKQALSDGRNGNKNNPAYLRKNYEINQLIDKLQSGQQVDPSEIDKALEPTHVW
jgi:hypothetical protein